MAKKCEFGAALASALILWIGGIASASQPTTIGGEKWDLTTYINPPKSESVTRAESDAAFFYTGIDSHDINSALREGNASEIRHYSRKIFNLASLINKSRGKKCTFYRFIDSNPVLLDQMRTVGQIFVERGFFSTTLDQGVDDDGTFSSRQYLITGTSSHCADISMYSRFPAEREVLFPPGTEFVVTKNMNGTNIYLREK